MGSSATGGVARRCILAIAKDVVEQHGGQISLESVAWEGSTFYVTLPKG